MCYTRRSSREFSKMARDGLKTRYCWGKVRWVVASILLLAAIMKAWQLATVPALSEGLFYARWFNLAVVEFELAVGLWLIFGLLPKLSRWATIGLFTTFAGVSLYKALSGETSCGCFGSAQVNPWWTFVLDVVIVGVSFSCRNPRMIPPSFPVREIGCFVVSWIIVTMLIFCAVISVKKQDLSALGTEMKGIDGRKTVLVDPKKWQAGNFPLLPYIEPVEVRESLRTGEWTILLYRSNCPQCQQEIAELASKGTPGVVCVEVPPYGVESVVPVGFVHASLTDKMAWIVETPVVEHLVNATSGMW